MDCLLIYYRQKDDPMNAIIAGFITGGVLAIRGISFHVIFRRRSQCSFQKRFGRRSDPSPDRRSHSCSNSNLNAPIVLNDGGNAESRARTNEEAAAKRQNNWA